MLFNKDVIIIIKTLLLWSIAKVFDFRTFDCVRFVKVLREFDYACLITEPNRSQSKVIEGLEFVWVDYLTFD